MKAIKCEPGKEAQIVEIDNKLEALQAAVEGYIEAYYPYPDEIAIICNEEGKINGMDPNRAIYTESGELADIICGPFLIVGLSPDNFASLSDDLALKYYERFKEPETFGDDVKESGALDPWISFTMF